LSDATVSPQIDPTLIGCPVCDAVYRLPQDAATRPTRCTRCGHRMTLGKGAAIARVVSLAATNVVLLGMVLFLPFLDLRAGQFENRASVFDVILGFSTGIMVPLALAVLGFILILPLSRFLLVIYALGPLAIGRANWAGAEIALRWAFLLKPWAMAEIFMVGTAVALVKLADLATISVGPAFWIFGLLVLLNALQDSFMCRNTLWTALQWNG